MATIAYTGAIGVADAGSGTVLAMGGSLSVSAKDILVCIASWEDNAVSVTSITDGGSNTFDMKPRVGTGDNYIQMGVILSAAAATSTFTLTLNGAAPFRFFGILQFTPDGTKITSLAGGPNGATDSGTTAQSGNISTGAGDDFVLVGCAKWYTWATPTSEQTADTTADGVLEIGGASTEGALWYNLFTSAKTDVHAQATIPSTTWACDILAIASAAAGGATILLQMMEHHGG